VFYNRQALPTLHGHLGFSFLCCVFVWFVFGLCLVYIMLPVSLDCLLLITPAVSNVYLLIKRKNKYIQDINLFGILAQS